MPADQTLPKPSAIDTQLDVVVEDENDAAGFMPKPSRFDTRKPGKFVRPERLD